MNRAIDDQPGIQQETICYQWFKQRLILSVSEPSISQQSQIKEDTVEPSVPAQQFNLKAYAAITWHNDRVSPGLEPGLADHRNQAARTVTLPTAPPRQATLIFNCVKFFSHDWRLNCINLTALLIRDVCVQVKGLPANQGQLYRADIENMFKCCDQHHRKPKVHFEETRHVLCVVSFYTRQHVTWWYWVKINERTIMHFSSWGSLCISQEITWVRALNKTGKSNNGSFWSFHSYRLVWVPGTVVIE